MKYKRYTLAELVSIKYGKNQKKVLADEGKFPIYGTGGLMGYATEYLYDKPSVLIGRKGTIGKVKYVDHPFWTVDTLFYTIVNTEIVIPKYLYYVMSLVDLNNYNEGTTIPSLRTETLNRLEFDIPSLEEQEMILSCLNPIDEKIKLNNAINNNLEQQVSALYQSWFEDFDLSNGCCPDNWTNKTLSDIAYVSSGKRPPIKKETYSQETPIPIVGAASVMGFTSEANHTDKILVTGRVGTHGVIQRFNAPCWTSDNTLVITSSYYEFTNQILRRIDYSSMNRGSTQPLITQGDMNKVDILVPDDEILAKFEELAGTLMAQYEANILENIKLAFIRDSLLPKLMSGELDVSNIDL
ncbi:MAG: restriction endonuclease subunit S [Lachnospiraceae bacterium]|nr:restriction endonuclease subunit S [Lachnospiraceae bacterium]